MFQRNQSPNPSFNSSVKDILITCVSLSLFWTHRSNFPSASRPQTQRPIQFCVAQIKFRQTLLVELIESHFLRAQEAVAAHGVPALSGDVRRRACIRLVCVLIILI